MTGYFIFDVETCPVKLEGYEELPEEDKRKMMNPIDSRIVALGVRHAGKSKIFIGEEEKKILKEFWAEWARIQKAENGAFAAGFNIHDFDLPFITTRSFINNVVIEPFLLKQTIDLRDKLSAYKFGKVRGKLKELGGLIGLKVEEEDGSMMAGWWAKKELETIKKYLGRDLEITDEIYKRAEETRVLEIERW